MIAVVSLVVAAAVTTASASVAGELPPDLRRLVDGAQAQVGVTVHYDPSYVSLPFPGGDVPADRGVCTDVIVRAYRTIGVDLQLLVHQDMNQALAAYPRKWGPRRPDPSIDHRRVENLAVFFARNGANLPVSTKAQDYRPGDIVTWRLPGGQPHIGLVSDRSAGGTPLMVHNIGAGARIEDVLFAYTVTGHYRYVPRQTRD